MNNENNENYKKSYKQNNEENSQIVGNVFIALLKTIFVILLLFGIILGLIVYAEKKKEEKAKQDQYEEVRKKQEEEYKIAKQKEEDRKKRQERNKKIEEEFRKKKEERDRLRQENKELLEETIKELNEIYSNLKAKRHEYLSMSEEKLIDEFNKILPIYDKLEKIKDLESEIGPRFFIFRKITSFYISMALHKDYSQLLEIFISKKIFISKNRKVNFMPIPFFLADIDSRKCLELVLKEDYDLKEELISEKYKDIYKNNENYKIEDGLNLLHLAAKRGNVSLAERVLNAGVSVNQPTKAGITPLDYAIENYQYEMVEYLLNKGATISNELISSISDEKNRKEELIKWMKEKEKENKIEKQAIEQNNDDYSSTSEWLNKTIEEKQQTDSSSSRQIIAYMNLPEDELIEKITEDFKEKRTYYMPVPVPIPANPLVLKAFLVEIAIEKNYAEFLNLLCNPEFHPVDLSIDASEIITKTNLNLIIHAAEVDRRECIEVFLKNGADLKVEVQEGKNKNGNLLLEIGKTLLHCAAQNGNIELAKMVLEAGVPIDKKTREGHTPLWFSVKYNQKEMAKFLIEKGAEVTQEIISLTTDAEMTAILNKGLKKGH